MHATSRLIGALTAMLLVLSMSACSDRTATAPDGYGISGRITEGGGKGLAEVTVTVSGGSLVKKGRTDGNGRYAVSGLAAGMYVILPARKGYTFSPDSLTVEVAGSDAAAPDIIAAEAASIRGIVIDRDGRGVSGITLTLTGGSVSLTALTDARGAYSFSGISPGVYTLVPSGTDLLFNHTASRIEVGSPGQEAAPIVAFTPVRRDVDAQSFLGFEINRANPGVRVYRLANPKTLAAGYRAGGMRWFAPIGVDYTNLDEHKVPKNPYPVSVCHTAFGFHKYWFETGMESNRYWFLANVDWLIEHRDANSYLYYPFRKEHYPGVVHTPPWVSAMAQGEALAAACMAYQLTGQEKYLEAARSFFATLFRNSGGFWCIGVDREGYYWLEEYPSPDFCHVLNGMLFGLWGLWDYYALTGDEFALTLFEAGIKSIVDHHPSYRVDGKNGSRYCLHYAGSAGETYHAIHLIQIQTYAEFFAIPELWDAYSMFLGE